LFSFWACPWAADVAWDSLSSDSPKSKSLEQARMEGVRPRQRLHETPVFMRVRENPVVGYNAASGGLKSMGKGRFPQFSWDFVPFSLGIVGFSGILTVFEHLECKKSRPL
jgi:hypothetical protein